MFRSALSAPAGRISDWVHGDNVLRRVRNGDCFVGFFTGMNSPLALLGPGGGSRKVPLI
jgi:hypothetical protein